MTDRNSIIEKIKALLSKTTENGATEAEMLSALDKARAMMDTYEIGDDELQLAKDEAAILHSEAPDLKDPHKIKWRLSYGVAQFCGVKIYRNSHETALKFIGAPSDAQFAAWLLDNLADFVFAELYAHLIGCLAPKSERKVIIRSFTAACCERITARLLALVERSKAARPRITNPPELRKFEDFKRTWEGLSDEHRKAFVKEFNIDLADLQKSIVEQSSIANPRTSVMA